MAASANPALEPGAGRIKFVAKDRFASVALSAKDSDAVFASVINDSAGELFSLLFI